MPGAQLEPTGGAEFPLEDEGLWLLQRIGLESKLAAHRLAHAPESVDTLESLLRAKRLDDALRVLRRIVDRHPDRIAASFKAVFELERSDLTNDVAHGYADALQDIVVAARARVAALPREQAARAARQILWVDRAPLAALNAPPQADRSRLALTAFVSEYRGTEEGALTEIELVSRTTSVQALEELDRIAAAHPGTTIAAAALYAKGNALGNGLRFGERAGSDPTERFFRRLEIARELESGRYPASRWVSDAPFLVLGSLGYQPQYEPGNLERVLEAQVAYLSAHLRGDDDDRMRETLPNYIRYPLPNLLALKGGDVVTGVESVLTRLEEKPESRNAVRYARALFYLRRALDRPSDDERRVLRVKAQQTLESLSASSSPDFYKRKALATLGTFHFNQRHFSEARSAYQTYVQRYPDRPYAWVAALRAARCEWLLGDPNAAAVAFRSAAARFRAIQVALVFGYAYAARAAEATSDFRQALADNRRAVAAWDEAYRPIDALLSGWNHDPRRPFPDADDERLTSEVLSLRIAQLQRSTAVADGMAMERGRWLLAHARWDEAIAALSPLSTMSTASASPLAIEARYLTHRARVERALEIADVEKPDRDVPTAVEELHAVVREPFDFNVATAKIALASLMSFGDAPGDARALMSEAVSAWREMDRLQPPAAPRGDLEREAIAVRNASFLPTGGGLFSAFGNYKFSSGAGATYFVVDPDLRVKVAGGAAVTITAYDRFPAFDNVLFMPRERELLLERVMTRLGGTNRRAQGSMMALWGTFFAVQPPGMGVPWIFQTAPIISLIEFTDAARTRAAVPVIVGHQGATVLLEKHDGAWVAKSLANRWIS